MKKVPIDRNLFSLPWTQAILGTHLDGKANFMAVDWLTRTNFEPPMLGVCVNKGNASSRAILAEGQYSVNVPTRDMVEITDYTGLVSGSKVDKSGLFNTFYGDLEAAPMIHSCPVTIECSLERTVDLPTNNFFIGEMVNVFVGEEFLVDGKPSVEKIRPFLLSMPDNRFWAVGESIGKAWGAGAVFLKGKKLPERC
jgi:flavin reductase (DIM6/NTAB) family NADH-FMN oxidoreductase RutF